MKRPTVKDLLNFNSANEEQTSEIKSQLVESWEPKSFNFSTKKYSAWAKSLKYNVKTGSETSNWSGPDGSHSSQKI